MNIDSIHIASKKKVGTLRGKPIVELVTTGGLYLIIAAKDGSFETLSTGPHRAVARHIAKKREQDIQWSDLSKSDWYDPETYAWILPRYEALTDLLRKTQGDE